MPAVLRRNFVQRLFGLCATKPPADPGCFRFEGDCLIVDLFRTPELGERSGAIRAEKKGRAARVLVIRGEDGRFHAFSNRCSHGGRRLDPVPGEEQVQCCSVGKSTFDYEGGLISGTAESGTHVYAVEERRGTLVVHLNDA